ncbi:MAG: hypothetical protein JSV43_05960 [Methanobacteriota archaeon]|nr:MAG: hypothetical protein JSV43_05960 [Euryarchaeota archaeon]
MAKKRKKEVKSYVFKVPEFDEEEYMKKEIANARVAIITIIFAIPASIASYSLTLAGSAVFGFLVGFAFIFLLRYIYEFLHVEIEKFERKDWLGNGAMFFFTWLAVWVLILNMPFTDLTKPTIGVVYTDDCTDLYILNWTEQNMCTPTDGSTRYVTIRTRVTDNAEVQRAKINFTVGDAGEYNLIKVGDRGQYQYTFQLALGTDYTFRIIAQDVNNHWNQSPQYTITGT